MGRRPPSSRLADRSHMHESTNPSGEAVALEPEGNNPSEKAEVQAESTHPALDKVEPQQARSKSSFRRKVLKQSPAKVRRSQRLQNVVMTSENRDIERILEEITVSESEKENEPAYEELPEQVPSPDENTIYQKVDYILRLLQEQKITLDELASRATGRAFFSEGSGMGDFTYKGLYIDSQKKVEALMTENYQLNKKLEYALGKIEVYEKGNHVNPEVLEKLKDMFFCSSLTRATEAAVMSGTIPAENGRECKGSAKRKRQDKET